MSKIDVANITDQELAAFIAENIEIVAKGDVSEAGFVRQTFEKAGIVEGAYVGEKNFTPRTIMLWYAGQFMNIVTNQSWFAVNSIINCCEKFTVDALDPEKFAAMTAPKQ